MAEAHAVTRFRERYGGEITRDDLPAISRTAQTDGILVAKQSDGGTIWLMKWNGIVCRVVLSRMKNVMTFLPPNAKLNKARI